jgi:hypothetical protein
MEIVSVTNKTSANLKVDTKTLLYIETNLSWRILSARGKLVPKRVVSNRIPNIAQFRFFLLKT